MKICVTPTFESQLQEIVQELLAHDEAYAKSFKMYLDTILLNIPTKTAKYKPFEPLAQEGVQQIQHKGLTIPFYHDEKNETFIVLGVLKG